MYDRWSEETVHVTECIQRSKRNLVELITLFFFFILWLLGIELMSTRLYPFVASLCWPVFE